MNSTTIFIILIILLFIFLSKKIEKFTISRPSKCFDCERQIISHQGIFSAWKALPTKCFDCESQSNTPYHTGPSKCFDCDYFHNNGIGHIKEDDEFLSETSDN